MICRRTTSVILLVLLLALVIPIPALAYESRSDTNITIGSDEVINDDLYLVGYNITIDGTINGDLFALGQTIIINGEINGGVSIAGQTITINGDITHGARLAGMTINMNGNIDGDLLIIGSDLNISSTAEIGRDLVLSCDDVNINGYVANNVLGWANQMTITNRIDGDIELSVTNLVITSTAIIGGDLTYTSANNAVIQQGADISGSVDQILPDKPEARPETLLAGIFGTIIFKILSFVAIFIIGLIFIFAAPRLTRLLSLSLKHGTVMCLGWGSLVFFVTPVVAFIIMFTVIGIPLALIALALWGILIYLSQIPVALIIGWLILGGGRENVSSAFLTGALALGLFIIYVVSLIPVFGWIFWLFVMIFGTGTVITVFRKPLSIS